MPTIRTISSQTSWEFTISWRKGGTLAVMRSASTPTSKPSLFKIFTILSRGICAPIIEFISFSLKPTISGSKAFEIFCVPAYRLTALFLSSNLNSRSSPSLSFGSLPLLERYTCSSPFRLLFSFTALAIISGAV